MAIDDAIQFGEEGGIDDGSLETATNVTAINSDYNSPKHKPCVESDARSRLCFLIGLGEGFRQMATSLSYLAGLSRRKPSVTSQFDR